MKANASTQQQLINALKGQTFQVPDIRTLFAEWPVKVNPLYESLACEVAGMIRRLIPDEGKAAKLEKPDFALYASFWCPDVTWDKLKIMTFFITWSFIWDDEIDVSEGSYHFDFAEAQAYREESLKAIQNALWLGEQPDAQGTAGQNTFLRSFEILGKPLCEEYTIAQRKRFLREWVRFLEASEWEQRRRIEGTIPSLDEYLACRMGTNGAYVLLALDEFALGIQLPQKAMDHPAMQILWEAMNKILSILNDIYSAKKELAMDSVDNIISVFSTQEKSLQQGSELAIELLKETIATFDNAADCLNNMANSPSEAYSVKEFIQNCRYHCTGYLNWCLVTPRFRVQDLPKTAQGGFMITF